MRQNEAPTGDIRALSRRLVLLDNGPGPAPVADLAAGALAGVLAGLRAHPTEDREVLAATGELAEITGWLLFDAERHPAARRAARLALDLADRAGDRPIQLLTLQNTALQDEWLGRPRHALSLARAVLDARPLPPRAEAVFRLRAAAAGSDAETAAAFSDARALLAWGGGRRPDPPMVVVAHRSGDRRPAGRTPPRPGRVAAGRPAAAPRRRRWQHRLPGAVRRAAAGLPAGTARLE
ncbi:hypothetical protein [Streptomyces litchfieldiae]|uniref:LuxR family transcriptional regulator n=1 Tax=Streptomyces litchfieldiae TaxID=3075543 RepID=A0ABU2MK66_9ACTN|nr:hypothetical protein [Streptomyces sp. DSM 44938]MDT0341996.1 hypothetical protein [Streptomyces sp. DSM 44938]